MLSLIPRVGAIYAPLIVAGVFLLAILATMLWLELVRARQQRPATPLHVSADATQAQRQAQFARIAMIIEAVMLGYSLSPRR